MSELCIVTTESETFMVCINSHHLIAIVFFLTITLVLLTIHLTILLNLNL